MSAYYLFWLLVPTALALATAHPAILGVVVFAYLARGWFFDPVSFMKHARRVRTLRATLAVNASNATAAAELAEIWLDKRRPRRAIPLIQRSLERDPESAELHYLLGLAQVRAGEPAAGLAELTIACERAPKVRYGSAFLARGDAHSALGQHADAIADYERFVKIHTSSLEGYCKLAKARERGGDATGARRARDEALETFRVLPRYQRRKQLGWWLRARLGF